MAQLRTTEEAAKRILEIIVYHFKVRANGSLPLSSLNATWFKDGWNAKDFNEGLQYGKDAGWLTQTTLHVGITDSGFAEA